MKDTTLLKLGAWLMALLVFAITGVVALILRPYVVFFIYVGFPNNTASNIVAMVGILAFVLACLLARMSYKWIIRRNRSPRWAKK